ncbi:MAG: FkbM family methyltransferase [Hyphomicrobiales bacterium]|nr:FkbM family methyltransferase [Hyphomicrobiales bacterium]MCP4999643.1 FkbM family methyltransferase [Hyphomicrobiales bacterium]
MLDLAKSRNAILSEKNPAIRSFLKFAMSMSNITRSQIFQDAFVVYVLDKMENGYFCEFGATNGISLSNSYMLENEFNWTGICAEPARCWHEELTKSRPNTIIETNCVWASSGETLAFSELRTRELSTLSDFAGTDEHARKRRKAVTYQVETISLNDLLDKHNAPLDFDFLSIDTEGSELAILNTFDLTRFQPKIMTVEHNYTNSRTAIYELLTAQGYTRVLHEISLFDDWYLADGIKLPEPGI